MFSRLRTGRIKIPEAVWKHFVSSVDRKEALENVSSTFKAHLLQEDKHHNLATKLLELVDEDEDKADLNEKATNAHISTFMAELLLRIVENDALAHKGSNKAKELKQTMKITPLSNIPKENVYFQGRSDKLNDLQKGFMSRKKEITTQVLYGLGGVGKTQTAMKYAYDHKDKYGVICYLNAASHSTLILSIIKFFEATDIIKKDASEAVVRDTFRRWFEECRLKWLIIFDEVDWEDNDYDISTFMPQIGKGYVIWTTRLAPDRAEELSGKFIKIGTFDKDTALSFLNKRTGLDIDEHAEFLAERLGYLPLALEHAAAYIAMVRSTNFEKYVSYLEKRGLTLLDAKVEDEHERNKKSVRTTWDISMEKIKLESAEQFLSMISFLAPDNIPFSFVIESITKRNSSHSRSKFESLTSDFQRKEGEYHEDIKMIANSILVELTKYSLVQYFEESDTVSIHRLLQEVIRDRIELDDTFFGVLHGFFAPLMFKIRKEKERNYYLNWFFENLYEHMYTIGKHLVTIANSTQDDAYCLRTGNYHYRLGAFNMQCTPLSEMNFEYALDAYQIALDMHKRALIVISKCDAYIAAKDLDNATKAFRISEKMHDIESLYIYNDPTNALRGIAKFVYERGAKLHERVYTILLAISQLLEKQCKFDESLEYVLKYLNALHAYEEFFQARKDDYEDGAVCPCSLVESNSDMCVDCSVNVRPRSVHAEIKDVEEKTSRLQARFKK